MMLRSNKTLAAPLAALKVDQAFAKAALDKDMADKAYAQAARAFAPIKGEGIFKYELQMLFAEMKRIEGGQGQTFTKKTFLKKVECSTRIYLLVEKNLHWLLDEPRYAGMLAAVFDRADELLEQLDRNCAAFGMKTRSDLKPCDELRDVLERVATEIYEYKV